MSNLEHISKVIRTNGREFKVLDVADGMGDIRFRFLEAGRCVERCKSSGMDDVNITICDINANMLEVDQLHATQRYLSSINKALSFIEGNAEILPFEDYAFDCLWTA